MSIPCPYGDPYPSSGTPNEQLADFFSHLGTHFPNLKWLFDAIAAKMRDPLEVPVSGPVPR